MQCPNLRSCKRKPCDPKLTKCPMCHLIYPAHASK